MRIVYHALGLYTTRIPSLLVLRGVKMTTKVSRGRGITKVKKK